MHAQTVYRRAAKFDTVTHRGKVCRDRPHPGPSGRSPWPKTLLDPCACRVIKFYTV